MFRPLLWPTVFSVAALGVLISLGNWQLERLDWKNELARRVTAQAGAGVVALPGAQSWPTLDLDDWEYRPVAVTGIYEYSAEIHVYTVVGTARGKFSGPGYWIMTPLELAGGGAVLVNRGFVPPSLKEAQTRKEAQVPGVRKVTGRLRRAEKPGAFTPEPDLKNNVWTLRDVPAMATALGRTDLAPFFIDADAGAKGALPQGGETRLKFTNKHLDYALTWYGLGIVLVVVYLAFHRAQGRFGKPRAASERKTKET